MNFNKIFFVFLIATFACDDPLGFGDDCFDCGDFPPVLDCGGVPCPDDPPPPPPPAPVSRYELGEDAGEDDADYLFHGAFTFGYCEGAPGFFDNTIKGLDKDDGFSEFPKPGKGYPTYDQCQEDIRCRIDYTKIAVCYVNKYNGSRTQFNQDVIDYRQLTQNKINNGLDVDFNRGLLDGFNKRLLKYSLNYGIGMP